MPRDDGSPKLTEVGPMSLNVKAPKELYAKPRKSRRHGRSQWTNVFASVFAEHLAALERLKLRAARGDRDKILAALDKVPDAEPDESRQALTCEPLQRAAELRVEAARTPSVLLLAERPLGLSGRRLNGAFGRSPKNPPRKLLKNKEQSWAKRPNRRPRERKVSAQPALARPSS